MYAILPRQTSDVPRQEILFYDNVLYPEMPCTISAYRGLYRRRPKELEISISNR